MTLLPRRLAVECSASEQLVPRHFVTLSPAKSDLKTLSHSVPGPHDGWHACICTMALSWKSRDGACTASLVYIVGTNRDVVGLLRSIVDLDSHSSLQADPFCTVAKYSDNLSGRLDAASHTGNIPQGCSSVEAPYKPLTLCHLSICPSCFPSRVCSSANHLESVAFSRDDTRTTTTEVSRGTLEQVQGRRVHNRRAKVEVHGGEARASSRPLLKVPIPFHYQSHTTSPQYWYECRTERGIYHDGWEHWFP